MSLSKTVRDAQEELLKWGYKSCIGKGSCGQIKSVSEFGPRALGLAGLAGLSGICRPCSAARSSENRRLWATRHQCRVEGCERGQREQGYCSMHFSRLIRSGDLGPVDSTRTRRDGVNRRGYRTVRVDGKRVLAHRHIVEVHLGRPLLPEENVHHINGDRLDNRIENLEIWNTSQPSGQRVADKVSWAKEILALYGEG